MFNIFQGLSSLLEEEKQKKEGTYLQNKPSYYGEQQKKQIQPSFYTPSSIEPLGTNAPEPQQDQKQEGEGGFFNSMFRDMEKGGAELSQKIHGWGESVVRAGYGQSREKTKDAVVDMLNRGYKENQIYENLKLLKEQGRLDNDWSERPFLGTLSSVAKGALGGVAAVEAGASSLGRGGQQMIQGDIGTGLSTIGKGALQTTLGSFGTALNATPVGAGVNTLFHTDTVGENWDSYIHNPIMTAITTGQGVLGFNPNSEASKNVQEIGAMGVPIVGAKGAHIALRKPVGKGIELVKEGTEKMKDATVETVGKVKDITLERVEKVGEFFGKEKGEKITVKEIKDNLFSDLSAAERKSIKENPHVKEYWRDLNDRIKSNEGLFDIKEFQVEKRGAIVKEFQSKVEKVAEDLSETGKAYNKIRESKQQLPVEPFINAITKELKDNGLSAKLQKITEKTSEGKEIVRNEYSIEKTGGLKSVAYTEADLNKISNIVNGLTHEAKANGGYLTPADAILARQKMSALAKYDTVSSADGLRLVRGLRKAFDTEAKAKVKGLKMLDKKYADKRESLYALQDQLVFKGGDKKGQWRDNLNSLISNINKDSKAPMKKRLQEIMPDLSRRMEAIEGVGKIYNRVEHPTILGKKVDAGQMTATVVGGALGGLPGGIAGYFLSGVVGKITNPLYKGYVKKAITNVLEKEKPSTIQKLEAIKEKQTNNILLKADEKNTVHKLYDNVIETIKKFKLSSKEKNYIIKNITILLPASADASKRRLKSVKEK